MHAYVGGVRVRVVRTQLGCSRGGVRVHGTRMATGSPSRRREQSGRPLEPRGGRGPGVWFGRRERAPELNVCEYVCVHRGELWSFFRSSPADLRVDRGGLRSLHTSHSKKGAGL